LTISQILQRDPALDALPADTAARVRQAVRLCLRKPLKDRIADIGSVRLLLDGSFEPDGIGAPTGGATAQTTWRRTFPFLLTALGAAVLGGIGVWRLMSSRTPAAHPVIRFALPVSASVAPRGIGVGRHVLAISQDANKGPLIRLARPTFTRCRSLVERHRLRSFRHLRA
jgi:hypothetical protein